MIDDTITTENPGEEKIPAIPEEDPTPNREPQPETPSCSIQGDKESESDKIRQEEGKKEALEAQNAPVSDEKQREEQERTRIKKTLFLGALGETLGDIVDACKMADIHRSTYYDWMDTDSDFKESVRQVHVKSIDDVKSIVTKLVRRGHAPTVRWWLERKTEEFKPRSAVAITPGNAIIFADMDQPTENENATDRQQEIPTTIPGEEA